MKEINEMQNLANDFFNFLADASTNEDFKNAMQDENNETELAIDFLADYPQMSDDYE